MPRSPLETTALSEIVQHDVRAGAILDGYHLDFCCGGSLTLADACQQRGIDVERVVADIDALSRPARDAPSDDPVALIAYIVETHHGYVRRSVPRIQEHLTKVVAAHGSRHAELAFIESQFSKVADDLLQHLVKEERVLFPYIESLADAARGSGPHPPDMFGTVQNPIRMMEVEHQEARDRLVAIRELSYNYAAPADACNTYRLVLDELEVFERDLNRHVDLENNVLFPMTLELEEKAERMGRGLKSWQWERPV